MQNTEIAFQVASEAVQLHGANGLTREYPVEKILRDARTVVIAHSDPDTLSLGGAESLLERCDCD